MVNIHSRIHRLSYRPNGSPRPVPPWNRESGFPATGVSKHELSMKPNDSPLVGWPNGFEGKHHAEFDRVPPRSVQSKFARVSRGLSRRRSQSLPRLRPHALDHRSASGRMRILLDRNAAQGSADARAGLIAGILERRPPELRGSG